VEKSLDDKFLFISPHSQITSEVWFISADEPDAEWKLFAPREQGVEYEVTSQNDDFLIVTNENAKNFKLMSVPIVRLPHLIILHFVSLIFDCLPLLFCSDGAG
jgi:oligopeptidase B